MKNIITWAKSSHAATFALPMIFMKNNTRGG
jgi:hypothetical protein